MITRPRITLLLTLFLAAFLQAKESAPASPPSPGAIVLPLWPEGKMPGVGAKEPEKMLPASGDGTTRITNVSEPTLTLYKARGMPKLTSAVILCPGGGYSILAMDPEMPTWLNSLGITVVVLNYRVPGNMGGAFQDIQRAMRLVRNYATEWNISPQRIGVMGISAGGHLCARLSTNWNKSTYPKLDQVDEAALRPDFTILLVPAYLSQVAGKVSKDIPVNAQTPPTFTLHAEDDKTFVRGTKLYHAALDAAQVKNEFFNPDVGGHSCPLISKEEIGQWTKKCQQWLIKVGII
jgi:acetyl esterase/lipase